LKVFLLLLVGLLVLWEGFWWLMGVRTVTPWKLKASLNEVRLVDVRTPPEFDWFHIEGAVNLPGLLYAPSFETPGDGRKPVVVVCMTGHRSPLAAYRLQRSGYKAVRHLLGGMAGWKLFGGATVASKTPSQG
jgi:rhodanese-related sulfurtransferase